MHGSGGMHGFHGGHFHGGVGVFGGPSYYGDYGSCWWSRRYHRWVC
jgi:hypothetical protein